jgi:hypothetical protein
MQPYYWTMTGLLFDILGALLLSVEAIKIDNFRQLRDRFLVPIHRQTISPRITFGKGVDDTNFWSRHLGFFMSLHWVAGLIVFLVLNRIMSGWMLAALANLALWFLSFTGWKLVAMLVLGIYGVVLFLLGIWMLGEVVHIALTFSTRCLVLLVEWIDRRTPTGSVGLIGFFLLFIGFLLQMYGTYSSRSMGRAN